MISEIDIKDMTELYNLKNGDNFAFADEELKTPPNAPDIDPTDIWKFLKVDGMYAQIQQAAGPISFVAAWTKVRKVGQ
jgi:hypothetical protein